MLGGCKIQSYMHTCTHADTHVHIQAWVVLMFTRKIHALIHTNEGTDMGRQRANHDDELLRPMVLPLPSAKRTVSTVRRVHACTASSIFCRTSCHDADTDTVTVQICSFESSASSCSSTNAPPHTFAEAAGGMLATVAWATLQTTGNIVVFWFQPVWLM